MLIVDTGAVTARLLIKVKPIDIFSLEKMLSIRVVLIQYRNRLNI